MSSSRPSLERVSTKNGPSGVLLWANHGQDTDSSKVFPAPPESTPYTTYTESQKRLISIAASITMLASPLTATIYLPLLPMLASHFHVSLQSINLTITVYVIFQAISPMLFATASDTLGRRPIYLGTYALYTAASLGLALNRSSYAGLLVLRALQSLGASAMMAIGYGVVADICVPAKRGAMLGPMLAVVNLGVCVGPVIGGWVAWGSGGFQWVFWALVIFGGAIVMVVGLGFPETARSIVGNGSVRPSRWRRTWWVLFKEWIEARADPKISGEPFTPYSDALEVSPERTKFKIPNPLDSLRILFWKDVALVLWAGGSPYAIYYCVQTTIPAIYKDLYGFDEFKIGLAFLTGGAGVIIGGYANGKMMDMNYRATARSIGHTIDKVAGDDLDHFPIEKARARGYWFILAAYIAALAGYGWSIQRKAHVSVPLILQFTLGFLATCFQQTFNALLVDIFPQSPSTAAAAGNITRCTLSSVAVAVMQPLVDAIGRGWFFTILTVISGGGGLVVNLCIVKWGMKWRTERLAQMRKKANAAREGGVSEKENRC